MRTAVAETSGAEAVEADATVATIGAAGIDAADMTDGATGTGATTGETAGRGNAEKSVVHVWVFGSENYGI